MTHTLSKRVGLPVAVCLAVVLVSAGIASAHIHPDPLAMQAGTSGTVGFAIEHGCDGSPTTDIKIQIPAGVTGVTPVDKAGWTGTVSGDTVEFAGGPLDADQEDHFDINLTAPTQAGDLTFPIIQTCASGELAWIEIQAEGAEEPEHPAPLLKITEGPPTSADLTPEPEEEEATDVASTAVSIAAVADEDSEDDSSNTGVIVAVVIGAIIVVGGGVLLARRRSATPKA